MEKSPADLVIAEIIEKYPKANNVNNEEELLADLIIRVKDVIKGYPPEIDLTPDIAKKVKLLEKPPKKRTDTFWTSKVGGVYLLAKRLLQAEETIVCYNYVMTNKNRLPKPIPKRGPGKSAFNALDKWEELYGPKAPTDRILQRVHNALTKAHIKLVAYFNSINGTKPPVDTVVVYESEEEEEKEEKEEVKEEEVKEEVKEDVKDEEEKNTKKRKKEETVVSDFDPYNIMIEYDLFARNPQTGVYVRTTSKRFCSAKEAIECGVKLYPGHQLIVHDFKIQSYK
ncbi:hypothetical protein OAB94_02160 [Flavobacteriaceae bacterium]|nr:hypothetical protein [Flavobacteriaceae bacterium]